MTKCREAGLEEERRERARLDKWTQRETAASDVLFITQSLVCCLIILSLTFGGRGTEQAGTGGEEGGCGWTG